jgi:exonuclease SbcD
MPFSPRRDLRRLRGRFEDLMQGAAGNREDYLFLELVDDGPVLDAMARLRQVYPNILGIQPAPRDTSAEEGTEILGPDPRELDPERLFEAFFRHSTGQELSEEERALFQDAATRALDAQEPA